jgi:hypothetical protein
MTEPEEDKHSTEATMKLWSSLKGAELNEVNKTLYIPLYGKSKVSRHGIFCALIMQ